MITAPSAHAAALIIVKMRAQLRPDHAYTARTSVAMPAMPGQPGTPAISSGSHTQSWNSVKSTHPPQTTPRIFGGPVAIGALPYSTRPQSYLLGSAVGGLYLALL